MRKLSAILVALVAMTACSKDQPSGDERTETRVGPTGGIAVSAGGEMSLTFPEGSLSAEETITIETVRGRDIPRLRSLVFELGPEGRTFDKPVTIRILGAVQESWEELAIANVDGAYPAIVEGSVWNRETGEVSAALDHFSAWAVVAIYNPCGGLACGAACTICDPLDTACVEPAPAEKACNRSGLCVDRSIAMCPGGDDAGEPEDASADVDGASSDDATADDATADDATVDDASVSDDAAEADAGPPTCTESFLQSPQPIVDILIIVDNSCSMSEEQTNLASSFNLLLSTLTNNNVDFHIGVTTTDIDVGGEQGRLVGTPPVLTSTTPNLMQAFATAVMRGTSGSGYEQGLEASRLALSPPLLTGVNVGFLRNEGSMTVIYVSDEPDQSASSTVSYVQFLQSFGGPRRVQANTIVGPVGTVCTGPGGNAEGSARYDDVRLATGGAFSSICDASWNQALTDLGGPGFGYLFEFQLASPAPASILSVTVDGVLVPELDGSGDPNWSYDAGSGTIVFSEGDVPPPAAVIIIEWGC